MRWVAILGLLLPLAAWGFPGMEKKAGDPEASAGGAAGSVGPTGPSSSGGGKLPTGHPALPPGHPPMDGEGAESAHQHEIKEKIAVRVLVRKRGGAPLGNAPVNLLVTLDGRPKDRLTGRTNAQGEARFPAVPWHEHAGLTAVAPFGGVNYYASAEVPPGKKEGLATVEVASTTQDGSKLRIHRAHLVVRPTRQGIQLGEILVIKNEGDATYAGEPIAIPLFAGAADLRAEGAVPGAFRLEGDVLHYRGYIRPGQSQIRYDYALPLMGEFKRKTMLPIDRLFVAMTAPRFRLSGPSLQQVREVKTNNVSFIMGEGKPIPKGGVISFAIAPPEEMLGRAPQGPGPAAAGSVGPRGPSSSGGVGPPGPSSSGGADAEGGDAPPGMGGPKKELVKDWRVVAKWLAPVFALVIFFVVIYLAARRTESDLGATDEGALLAERERLLGELARATRRAGAGERGAMRREAELTRKLAEVYRTIDERAARQAIASASALARPSSSGTPSKR